MVVGITVRGWLGMGGGRGRGLPVGMGAMVRVISCRNGLLHLSVSNHFAIASLYIWCS